MLILSRGKRESIMIGEAIEVFVIGIDGNSVRLGIRAARDIPVDRGELHELERRKRDQATHKPESD